VMPGPRSDARRRVGAPDGFAVTGTRQDAVVGVAECRLDGVDPRRAHLVELWVSPSERATGVGSHLLATCADAARRDLGAEVLTSGAEVAGPLGSFLVHRGFRRFPGGLQRLL
jgi:ribosomal protein S18 acetylase RimI-like enzyme